jgi:hypothetical protein
MKRIKSLLVAKEETVLNVFKLKAMARGKTSPAVLMYGSPDPDAVASAMALREILKQACGIGKCAFIATEPVARQQNREFIRAMKLDIQLLNKNDLGQYDLIALVDAQPTFFGQKLEILQIKPQIVLDHHPCATVWHAELADIRPNYGSVSTMMMEYLLAAKVRIPKTLYTALFYGIKTDTKNFERDAILEDIGAYYLAYSRANRRVLAYKFRNQKAGRTAFCSRAYFVSLSMRGIYHESFLFLRICVFLFRRRRCTRNESTASWEKSSLSVSLRASTGISTRAALLCPPALP